MWEVPKESANVLSNIFLVTSSKEKLSLYDVTKMSLQHYAAPPCHPHATPKPLGERLKEKKHSELPGHLGRLMVGGQKTVFCWVPLP
jgi:hypothetical protein